MISAARRSRLLRSYADIARIASAPRTSVPIAASMSVGVARGTVSTTEPSYGLLTSSFSARSTHLAAQNIFIAAP